MCDLLCNSLQAYSINIANAQVFDLSKDLNLEGTQYNTALGTFSSLLPLWSYDR